MEILVRIPRPRRPVASVYRRARETSAGFRRPCSSGEYARGHESENDGGASGVRRRIRPSTGDGKLRNSYKIAGFRGALRRKQRKPGVLLRQHRKPELCAEGHYVGKNRDSRCRSPSDPNGGLRMGSLAGRNCALILLSVVVGFSAFGHAQVPRAGHESLFSQSAAGILERDYTDADTSYLLLDVNSGALLASHWQGHDKPIP